MYLFSHKSAFVMKLNIVLVFFEVLLNLLMYLNSVTESLWGKEGLQVEVLIENVHWKCIEKIIKKLVMFLVQD